MLLFAHAGITVGAALGLETLTIQFGRLYRGNREAPQTGGAPTRRFMPVVDYRLVLIGSLLPDLIDKPLGLYFLPGTFHHGGYLFAHTFLFFLLLLVVGLYRRWRGGHMGMLMLALASGGHLLLDRLWRIKETLWWPFYGWSFPEDSEVDFWDWLKDLYDGLWREPATLAPEIIGAVVLLSFAVVLICRGSLIRFLKEGRLT